MGWLLTFLRVCFDSQKVLILKKSSLSTFSVLACAFDVISKKLLLNPRSSKVFLGDSDGKESACSAGHPGLGRSPGGGNGNPLQYFLENPHGQRSLTKSFSSFI